MSVGIYQWMMMIMMMMIALLYLSNYCLTTADRLLTIDLTLDIICLYYFIVQRRISGLRTFKVFKVV